LRLEAEKVLEMLDGLLKRLPCLQVLQVADMLAHKRLLLSPKTNGVFHMPSTS
jgi:hypothetical protein